MRLLRYSSRKKSIQKARQRTSAWDLGGLKWLQLAKNVWREMNDDEVFTRSAALSYYFFSALIPMVFFLMAVLGIFTHQSEHLRANLLNYSAQIMPPAAFTLVEKTLTEISNSSSGLKLAFGLVLSLWLGSGGMRSIMGALNRCSHVQESRPYWKRMLISLGLTVTMALLTICALAIVLYGAETAQFVGAHIGLGSVMVFAWKVVQWPVALAFVFVAFALIYYWGPDDKQQWHWISPGSLVGVVIWIGVSLVFRFYLHFYNSYSKTYGSLGAVIVLLFWLYITGLAILVGGEINAEIENAAA
ncbi:MAG TPA: YihY/virulence factor BrkB family protein [Candidatus Angelobacter sp.]|nr:YihY/virulence factor BrkB family protein [Candidatus Angelobacter sp.]